MNNKYLLEEIAINFVFLLRGCTHIKNKSRGWISIKNKTKTGLKFLILCMQYLYNAELNLDIKPHVKAFETAK